MATTREEFFKLLKEISAKLDHPVVTSLVSKASTAFSDKNILSSLSMIATTLSSILTQAISIAGEDFSTETTLSQIDTNTASNGGATMAQWLNNMNTILAAIQDNTDKTAGGRISAFLSQIRDSLATMDNDPTTETKLEAVRAKLVDIDLEVTKTTTAVEKIDTNTDTLESLQITTASNIVTNTSAVAAVEDELKGDITDLLTDIKTAVEKIENGQDPLGFLGILFIAMNVFLNSIENESIDTNTKLDTIETTLDSIEDEISLQLNRTYAYVADFDVTAIGGGTDIILKITTASTQRMLLDGRTIFTGTGTNTALIQILNGTTVIKDIESAMHTQGVVYHHPEDSTISPTEYTGFHHQFVLKGGHTLQFKLSGVAVNDRWFVAVVGDCRTTDLPVIDTTASSATIDTTTTENDID